MEVLTLTELQQLCLRRRLPATGSKDQLIQQLMRSSKLQAGNEKGRRGKGASETSVQTPNGGDCALLPRQYDATTIPQLKDLCRQRSLPVGGIKEDIVARLKAGDLKATGSSPPGGQQRGSAANTSTPSLGKEPSAGKKRRHRATMPAVIPAQQQPCEPLQKVTKRVLTFSSPHGAASADAPVAIQSTKEVQRMTAVVKEVASRPAMSALNCVDKTVKGRSKRQITAPATKKKRAADASPILSMVKTTPIIASTIPEKKKLVQLTLAQSLAALSGTTPPVNGDAKAQSSPAETERAYLVNCVEPSSYGPVAAFSNVNDANARVRDEFYEMHPQGAVRHTDSMKVRYTDGMLTLSMRPPHTIWKVSTMSVAAETTDVAAMKECYVVCSRCMLAGMELSFTWQQVFSTKEAANICMTRVFYEKNPWKMSKEELGRGKAVRQQTNDGMESLRKESDDDLVWDSLVMPVQGGDARSTRVSSMHELRVHKPPTLAAACVPSHQDLSSAVMLLPPSKKCFVVHTSTIFREERRGHLREPLYQFFPPVKSEKEANALAEAVFERFNPWGWSMGEIHAKPVDMALEDGSLLKMSVSDTDTWQVCVAAVCRSAHALDEDLASDILVYSMRSSKTPNAQRLEDPTVRIETILSTHQVTGTHVEELFCQYNPYGWGCKEFQGADSMIMKTFKDGLFTVSATHDQQGSWTMKCTPFTQKTVRESPGEDKHKNTDVPPDIEVKAEQIAPF